MLHAKLHVTASGAWETRVSGRETFVIFGAHVIIYSKDAEADRAFLADVLGFFSVDAGHGWLIFALPPAEVAVSSRGHCCSGRQRSARTLSDVQRSGSGNLDARGKGRPVFRVQKERWGSIVRILLPGGGEIGLYRPKHPTALTHPWVKRSRLIPRRQLQL